MGQVLRRAAAPARASAAVRDALKAASGFEGQQRFLPLLAGCPDADGLALVEAAAKASDAPTRSLGLRTLADWPEISAWTPLAAAYAEAASETERILALRGLARLLGEQNAKPDAQLIGRYRDLFASAKSDSDRKLVLGALAACAHPDALALAVEQLASPGVRAEATLAVKNIASLIKAQHPQAAEAALQKLRGISRPAGSAALLPEEPPRRSPWCGLPACSFQWQSAAGSRRTQTLRALPAAVAFRGRRAGRPGWGRIGSWNSGASFEL
ncbi:MAG: hypothetical protein M5U12_24920 [Verrucomicrobia bacterium]|nr:hypothetical protein [Verrucomicrobiota bacterium]